MSLDDRIRQKFEAECRPGCAKNWKLYEACVERVQGMDKLSHHDLAHVAEHHEINVHKKGGGLLPQEEILKSVKEAANCQPQYFEFFACLDKCVAPKLFAQLK